MYVDRILETYIIYTQETIKNISQSLKCDLGQTTVNDTRMIAEILLVVGIMHKGM